MAPPRGQLIYREIQYFAPWVYLVALMSLVGGLAALVTTPQMPPADKVGLTALVVALAAFIGLLRLEIEVRTEGVFVRLRPFPWFRVELRGCTSMRPVDYRPIRDYGGWGIRIGWKRRAYNARGCHGVRIDYEDGHHVLLGSQTPERLAEALRQLMESQGEAI